MLSVIVPFVREYPQVLFTIRSIHEELEGIEHEVIAIDNLMPGMEGDRGSPMVKNMAGEWKKKGDPWLKYYHYNKKLSHWQCKNLGMKVASGDIYWFVDAHCIVGKDTASRMYKAYRHSWDMLNGSFHLPLTYHILEPKQLIYKMVLKKSVGIYHYVFKGYYPERCKGSMNYFEVPAMSTCGMMIHKSLMDEIGRWPKELGIYGGGENFLNFTMAVLGMKKYIWKGKSLCHFGEERGYNWSYPDYHRNRTIASYMFGGRELLDKYLQYNVNISIPQKRAMTRDIISKCSGQRVMLKKKQVLNIEEWASQWIDTELCERK